MAMRGKGLAEAMRTPAARAWRRARLYNDDIAEFEEAVLAPLLARGAFDVAEKTVGLLRDADARKDLRTTIADARTKAASPAAPKDAASKLAALWNAYQQAKDDPNADPPHPEEAFLFAVRDLIAAQPDAFPLE